MVDLPHPALLLLNPRAAGGRAGRLAQPIQHWLQLHAPGVALHLPDSVAAARQLLHSAAPGSRVVLAGGDGSLHQLLPALLDGGHTLGLLPCGTGNDSARAFGLHRLAWPQALQLALSGTARPTDVGEVVLGGQATPFISSLAAGFDAAVAQRALRAPPWLRGLPRYLHATLAELAALRRFQLRVEVDGRVVHAGDALFASVLNTPSYGSGMPVAPAARIDDGQLNLVLAGHFGPVGALAMMPLLLAGLHTHHPRVALHPVTRLQLWSEPALPLAADGEALPETTTLQLRVRPGALAVVRR